MRKLSRWFVCRSSYLCCALYWPFYLHTDQGLGVADKLKINIEPGLFEWLAWYQDEMPSWMTAAELTAAGYNVEPGYKPYISSEELHDTVQETCGQFFIRNFFITQCALQVRFV